MDANLLGQVRDLILFSFSLTPMRKKELVGMLPNLNDAQLNALKEVFEEEDRRKNEIIAQAVEQNPGLAPKIEAIIRDNTTQMYHEIEQHEKPLEESQMANILKSL